MKTKILFFAFLVIACLFPDVSAVKIQWNSGIGANNHYYEAVFNSSVTWIQARDAAIAAGGHLATITSAEENAFVWSLCGSGLLFLGGYQSFSASSPSSDWAWVTGEAWSYTNWNAGEPNDGGGFDESDHSEQYLEMYSSGVWNDIYNNYTRNGYVIEYSVPELNTMAFFLTILAFLIYKKSR